MRIRGFTLIETLLYLALLAMVLPTVSLFIVHAARAQNTIAGRNAIEENATMVLEDMRYELQHAPSIQVSTSSFNTPTSRIRFIDRTGTANTIERTTDTYTANGESRIIYRVQNMRGTATEWLTSNTITVSSLVMNPVRDTSGDLTGINISVTVEPHVATTVAQQAQALTLSTSVWLPTYVQEQ